jgi:hypothetical protein
MPVGELAGPTFKHTILNPDVASQPIQARLFSVVVLLRFPSCRRGSTDLMRASGGNWQTFNSLAPSALTCEFRTRHGDFPSQKEY